MPQQPDLLFTITMAEHMSQGKGRSGLLSAGSSRPNAAHIVTQIILIVHSAMSWIEPHSVPPIAVEGYH